MAENRYRKQNLLHILNANDQNKLKNTRMAIAGCGATGSSAAQMLARMGVGYIRIIDRDIVELDNLHRQVLFDEDDAAEAIPKAVAARNKLVGINSTLTIEAVVADINANTIAELLGGVDCIIDGSDNFRLRFLINDFSLQVGVPWVYAGVVSTYGTTCAFIPGKTPCFRCFLCDLPSPGSFETCDTSGVFPPAVHTVVAMQVTEALKIALGKQHQLVGKMQYFNLYSGSFSSFEIETPENGCPACGERDFQFLNSKVKASVTQLCGEAVFRIDLPAPGSEGLRNLGNRLKTDGKVTVNEYLLRLSLSGQEITLFQDGRTLIKGVSSEEAASELISKYIGL